MSDKGPEIIERDDVAVMFLRVEDEQAAIAAGWTELEQRVGSQSGRKFFGAFDATGNEYLVCVQLRDGDDPHALGLERGNLAGGRYARVRLRGEPPGVYADIQPVMQKLARRPDRDTARPGIEFYRRRDVIDLLMPVL